MDIIGQCVLTVMSGEFVLEPVLRNVCETGAVIKCYFLLRSRVRLKSPRWGDVWFVVGSVVFRANHSHHHMHSPRTRQPRHSARLPDEHVEHVARGEHRVERRVSRSTRGRRRRWERRWSERGEPVTEQRNGPHRGTLRMLIRRCSTRSLGSRRRPATNAPPYRRAC